MGYTTDFVGAFELNQKLDEVTHTFLKGLGTTRRMARNLKGFGVEGEFFCPIDDDYGQKRTPDVIDYNRPPKTQPDLWCQWIPTEDGMSIIWNSGEKFYNYEKWIRYIIGTTLAPRGYVLNGSVKWFGEERSDVGVITIADNVVKIGRLQNR